MQPGPQPEEFGGLHFQLHLGLQHLEQLLPHPVPGFQLSSCSPAPGSSLWALALSLLLLPQPFQAAEGFGSSTPSPSALRP